MSSPEPATAYDQDLHDVEPISLRLRTHRLLTLVAVLAMVVGVGSVLGGIAGAVYTWNQAAEQDIRTPVDARIPGAQVRGPLTMWAEADLITQRQLEATGGRYFFDLDELIPAVGPDGEPLLGPEGEPVMVPNPDRVDWVTATTLTSALHLGIIAWLMSAFAVLVGLVLAGVGHALFRLRLAEVGVH